MAYKKDYSYLLERASEYRGKIINETIYLEKIIDTYIATYFCDDKLRMAEMHYLFLGDNRMTFEGKKQVFDFICRNHDLDWYMAYKSKRDIKAKKETPHFILDLDYVIGERNLMAHCLLDTSDEARSNPDGKVYFLRFKNDKKGFPYNAVKYGEVMRLVYDLSNYILNRLNQLSKSPYHPLNTKPKE